MALGEDPHSYANFLEVRAEHLDLSFEVSFKRRVFSGSICIHLRRLSSECLVLKLDTKDLHILGVYDSPAGAAASTPLWFRLLPASSKLGGCLEISLPKVAREKDCVYIVFETLPGAGAIQWLEAAQTCGGKYPLVFTQSQAILARCLFPCQDTPAVKTSFTLSVTCPQPLVAVGSGLFKGKSDDETKGTNTYLFAQDMPVMSYLVAVICGNLEERSVGENSCIFVEPEMADETQVEIQGVPGEFISVAESIVRNKYVWGRYGIAICPRSFGYGGMENPNVTFFSASLLAGDRSLLPTLAHEITHSWSGNLVTNGRWKDFWLNEGFTRYIERRILGKIHGSAFRSLLLVVGYNDLVKAVGLLEATGDGRFTALEPNLVGIDPDEAFSRVPYEKGSLFLFYLERLVGGEDAMSGWLETYFADFAKKSIETKDFKDHFCAYFGKQGVDLASVDWELWLHGFGLPSFEPGEVVEQDLLKDSRALADRWLAGGTAVMYKVEPEGVSADDLKGWRAQQIMVFLDNLINAGAKKMPIDRLSRMDELYNLTETRNVEVGYRWLLLCLVNERKECLPAIHAFLGFHGRGVYVKPLYNALMRLDPEAAHRAYDAHASFYQETIRRQIAKLLKR